MKITARMVGMGALRKRMNGVAGNNLRRAAMIGIERTARAGERRVKTKFSGTPIRVRSGITRASIRTQLRPRSLSAVVGSSTRHVATLEEGATITPKKAKVLTIPLSAAGTKAGKSRGGPREVGRRYDATFWRKPKGSRNPILFGVRAGRGKKQLVPLFVGVKKVTIKGRHVFRDTAAEMGAVYARNMLDAIADALR